MIKIPDSGIFYPNNLSRILLLSLEDVLGVNGLKTILNLTGLSSLIDNYPPNNLESEFDFAKFSMIMAGLDELYGPHASKVMGMRAGNALFTEMLKIVGEPADVKTEEFQAKPLVEKIQYGLWVARNSFSKTKSAPIPQMDDGQFFYSVKYCPVCWGRTTTTPSCYLVAGMLQAAVRWSTNGKELNVTQQAAHSCGDPSCDFIVPITPSN
jgi:hypothetical protein